LSPERVWNFAPDNKASENSQKFLRYARQVLKKYDRDGSGVLERAEWDAMPGEPQKIDRKKDGAITLEELAEFAARFARSHPLKDDTAWQQAASQPPTSIFQPVTPADKDRAKATPEEGSPPANPPPAEQPQPAQDPTPATEAPQAAPPADQKKPVSETAPPKTSAKGKQQGGKKASPTRKYYAMIPADVPDWFRKCDADGDGQLTFGEFASDNSAAQRNMFDRYDSNGDGVMTVAEVLPSAKGTSDDGAAVASAKEPVPAKETKSPAKETKSLAKTPASTKTGKPAAKKPLAAKR
jgi:Ca2+-binding EF-hand superfamily protein